MCSDLWLHIVNCPLCSWPVGTGKELFTYHLTMVFLYFSCRQHIPDFQVMRLPISQKHQFYLSPAFIVHIHIVVLDDTFIILPLLLSASRQCFPTGNNRLQRAERNENKGTTLSMDFSYCIYRIIHKYAGVVKPWRN